MRICGPMVLAASLASGVLYSAGAATIYAASPSLTDVTSALTLAVEGDTVIVPAGTATWSSALIVSHGITLQGATTVNTSGSGTASDQTIILDNTPIDETNQYAGIIKAQSLTLTQSFRLTGFTFRPGTRTTVGTNGGVRVGGNCPSIRVDHCHFDNLKQSPSVKVSGWDYGVIDHCLFSAGSVNGPTLVIWHDIWGGKTFGEGSWAESSYWGSEKFIFIEDNVINNASSTVVVGGVDSKMGGRFVARHNTFYNCNGVNTHGTEYNNEAGVRACEMYNNEFHWTVAYPGGQLRSGTALVHDNTFYGIKPGSALGLPVYREDFTFAPWRGANGTVAWDLNDTEGNGTNVSGHAPHLYASGTHTGVNNSQALVVANAGWTTNQWVGYQLTNTSRGPAAGETYNSTVTSNTSNTIYYDVATSFYTPAMYFNTGDNFTIHRVLRALDQGGSGQRNAIARDSSGNPINPAWPNQTRDPAYSWNNVWEPLTYNQQMDIAGGGHSVVANIDYFNRTPKSGYTPYTYPHPLVSGVPSAPANLRVTN